MGTRMGEFVGMSRRQGSLHGIFSFFLVRHDGTCNEGVCYEEFLFLSFLIWLQADTEMQGYGPVLPSSR